MCIDKTEEIKKAIGNTFIELLVDCPHCDKSNDYWDLIEKEQLPDNGLSGENLSIDAECPDCGEYFQIEEMIY